ncbi:MAG: DUF2264 domain-containing protein [Clostridia bacterium]|nr:DUF2264 domain-containing protein [Clostridia bacterium]
MLKTRSDVIAYAKKICIPMLEAAAERRLSHRPCEVVDTIGYVPSQLEELFRPFWGIAPILRDGERLRITVRGEKKDVGEWLREVLVTGTDGDSEFAWDTNGKFVGLHAFCFQNITEIAGLLVGMYFAKAQTWDLLTCEEQRRVADWIYSASRELCIHIAGNNHIWFPLLCLLVLKRFGFEYPDTDRFLREGMDALDAMYIGNGWYSDGAFGRIDYYEAWSMHTYPLLWCLIEDASWEGYPEWRQKYLDRAALFLKDYVKFFDVSGAHPPFGRSLAYRFAAVAPFGLAIAAGADFDAALAKTVTLRNISYFEENALVGNDGILPPGYLYNAPALVENYTSSGGAYWATKSFLCLLLPESHPFWSSEEQPLPIESGAYLVKPSEPSLNFAVMGEKSSGVTVLNNHFQYYQNGIYCNPFNDMASYYNKFAYNSRSGFAISTHDLVSADNMICLETRDHAMTSHRWGFTDLGEEHGFMVSEHTPFSNDRGTVIRTWMRPLPNGWHLRVHRVTLSQEYRIYEGGFSVGLWDDYRESRTEGSGFSLWNRELISHIGTAASVPVKFAERRPQPGMHLLAPFAAYPAYRTDILPAGEYLFASVIGIHDRSAAVTLPYIAMNGCAVTLTLEDHVETFRFP